MKSGEERRSGSLFIIGITVGVLALTAGPALAALTFSCTIISGDGAVVIDSSSTISIGTSTATGVTIGNGTSTVTFPGSVTVDSRTTSPTYQNPLAVFLTLTPSGDVSNGDTSFAVVGDLDLDGTKNFGDGSTAGEFSININGTGNYGKTYGVQSFIQQYAGTSTALNAVWGWIGLYGGAITNATTFYAAAPTGGGVTPTNLFQYWSDSIAGVATNPYYSWFDSQGVRRVKEDSTFNGVGQAIEALYNPQFTKYTPGAANYERLVLGEWNSNVAEIGTENGGTGSSRALAFITASTTRMTIGSTGNVGIGTSTPSSVLQVVDPTNDSSTIRIGASSKHACLEMGASSGTIGATVYVYFDSNAAIYATTTKPSFCQ
jgi:hypothetical protein